MPYDMRTRTVAEIAKDEALSMTSRDLFTSRKFAREMTNLARNITGQYSEVSVQWDESEGASIAGTTGPRTRLNAGCFFVRQYSSNEMKYHILRGLLLHECGHILRTDFNALQDVEARFEKGRKMAKSLLPGLTEYMESKVEETGDYIGSLSAGKRMAAANLFHKVSNILEDGYVNPYMMKRYPGFANDLNACLDMQYDEVPTLTKLLANEKEKDMPRLFTMLSLIHTYALFAEVICETWQEKHEAVAMLSEMMEFIDEAVKEDDASLRIALQITIFSMLLPCLMQYMEKLEDDGMSEDEAAERIESELSSEEGKRGEGAAPKSVHTSEEARSSRGTAARERKEPAVPKPRGTDDDGDEGDSPVPDEEDEPEDGLSEREPYSKTKEEREKEEETYDKAADEIKRILNAEALERANAIMEDVRREELKLEAKGIRHGDIHNGVGCEIYRRSTVDESLVTQYDDVAESLENIAKRTAKEVNKILEKRRAGAVQHNLYIGRRLDAGALARHDGRVMSRRKLPQKHPTIAVALRCDESGSMSRDNRIAYVRAAAVIMYNFCHECRIPIAIYGDDETDIVNIRSYAEFDSKDGNDKYRLMDMRARSNNRDGYAIRYAAERLAKRKEDIKLLFVISDGLPLARNYSGMRAQEDIRSIVNEYERKNVLTIAAAIGDDKEQTCEIYGEDRFLDIEDLEKLPETLVSVLRRYLKA